MAPGSRSVSVCGVELWPICASASVTAYSAATRAVVYFTPITVTAPSTPS